MLLVLARCALTLFTKIMLWILIRSVSPLKQKKSCGYSLEVPHQGTSYEYPKYSQTYVKQAPMEKPNIGCLRQVLA